MSVSMSGRGPSLAYWRQALAALEFALHGPPHEVSAVLAVTQHSTDALEGPLWEPRLHILRPSLLPAHVGRRI